MTALRALPPVGATVILRDTRLPYCVECVVTESPTNPKGTICAWASDADRRISVRGIEDPTCRKTCIRGCASART